MVIDGILNWGNIMRAYVFALLMMGVTSYVHAAEARPLTTEELQAFRGSYDLADGKLLTVSERRHKLFAQVNDGPTIELVATGAKTFITKSGTLRVDFDQSPNGSVAGVRVMWQGG